MHGAHKTFSPSTGPESILGVVFPVLIALFVYTLGLAIGPRVSGEALDAVSPTGGRLNCLTAIDLPGPFGILLNCDSPAFMEAASHPGQLLQQNNQRQERPGQIWLAWLISRPLLPLASVLGELGERPDVAIPQGATRTRAQAIADLAPGFIAFYLLNAAILLTAVAFLRSATGSSDTDSQVVSLTAAVLLFNDVTKAYLITPHSQLMNLLVPLVMVWTLFRWLEGKGMSVAEIVLLSAFAGFGVLAYPTWALVPVVLFLGMVWCLRPGNTVLQNTARRALRWLPASLAIVVSPYVLWYLYVRHAVGSFYTHAITHDGALVWLAGDPATVATRFIDTIGVSLHYAIEQAVPYLVLAIPAITALSTRRATLGPAQLMRLRTSSAAAAIISVMFLLFFALSGFKGWRYAVATVPAWSVPLAIFNASVFRSLSDDRDRFLFKLSLVTLVVCIGAAYVIKEGPWG